MCWLVSNEDFPVPQQKRVAFHNRARRKLPFFREPVIGLRSDQKNIARQVNGCHGC